jgi:hypothetical protein
MIRAAVAADVPNLVSLFKKHHKEMGCTWSLDTVRLSMTLSQAIASPDNWLVLAGDGCFLLASCSESILGAGKLATEHCFCVTAGNLDCVIKHYVDWARSKGCVQISLSCEQRFAAFQRLYRRYGFLPAEMTTSKAL